jgi:sulfate permease, SulP family
VFVALTLVIIYVLPRFTKAVPSPLVAIVVMTIAAIFGGFNLRTVGDLGEITKSLPIFSIPNVPWNMETLSIIFPTALGLSIVGLTESLLTASIVDDMTDTSSNKNQESRGQGIANIVVGFFGGMAGCAMIGQTVIFLMFLILVLGDWVVKIPMAALAGVMIMVSIGTFDWSSLRTLTKVPLTDTVVMLVTVITVVATHDLSKGVIAGVILSAVFFAAKISKLDVSAKESEHRTVYKVKGQLFFASVEDFVNSFAFTEKQDQILIDFSEAHIWDDSAVAAIDKIVLKLKEQTSAEVKLTGLNDVSEELLQRLATYNKPSARASAH